MKRRRFVVAGGALGLALLGGAALTAASGDASPSTPASTNASTDTAAVEKRDLVEREELSGTLGYGETHDVALGNGIVTSLAAEGAVVDRGQAIAEIDGKPVVVLFGARPMWRPLGEGVTDGPDIRQLEENLVALGFATAGNVGPNDTWSAATTAAVKRWQKSLGRDETGVGQPGDVVIEPGPVRIAEHVSAGAGQGLKVSAISRIVTVELDADRRDLLAVDQPVDIELPDGTVVTGKVTSIGSVVKVSAQSGISTVDVVITPDDPTATGDLDQAPVTVRVETSRAEGVLAVPVDALLALAEGGYAVEVPRGATTELVGVELGAFADGWVEVTGDLAEGDDVVVP